MVDFFIHVADAAIGLRRALKKEKSGQKNTVFYCCRARKKRYDIVRDVFFNTRMYKYCIDGGAVKKHLATVREKTNPTTWNHIFQLQRQSRGPYRGHENCCRFATLQLEHQRLDRRVDFSIRGDAGVMAEIRNVERKKNGGRGASSRGFVRKIGFSDFFLWAMQHRWSEITTTLVENIASI